MTKAISSSGQPIMLVVDDYMKPKPKAECKLWKCTGCLENNKNKNKE